MSFPTSAPKVPAWKRLGLKLKSAASPSATGGPASRNSTSNSTPDARRETTTPKRKLPSDYDHSVTAARSSSLKKPRRGDPDLDISGDAAFQKRKSVSFSTDSKPAARSAAPHQKSLAKANGKSAQNSKEPKKPKKPKPKKKKKSKTEKGTAKESENPTISSEETIEYLRRWRTARDSWRFSTNHQRHLLENAFDPALLPAAEIDALYDYIQGLKGFARERLTRRARDVVKTDKFPDGTKDVEAMEKEYQDILARFLAPRQGGGAGSKRKFFSETEVTATSENGTVTSRVVKRMRAEIILDELANGDAEAAPSQPTKGGESAEGGAGAAAEADNGKRAKGSESVAARPAKRIRASKRRTGGDDSSSSSSESEDGDDDDEEGEDDEESESSSSSSSDDSDSGDGDAMDTNQEYPDTSSSSSSSSDEDSGEDSEEGDDEDEDEGQEAV